MPLARQRAFELRQRFGLAGRVPNEAFRAIADAYRLPVLRRPLDTLDGVYLGNLILLHVHLAHDELRWGFPHELAHHLFDVGNDLTERDWVPRARRERRAELFSGYLLMGDPVGLPAWWLAQHHDLPYERVARWLDLRAGWLAISSPAAELANYRPVEAPHRWNYA